MWLSYQNHKHKTVLIHRKTSIRSSIQSIGCDYWLCNWWLELLDVWIAWSTSVVPINVTFINYIFKWRLLCSTKLWCLLIMRYIQYPTAIISVMNEGLSLKHNVPALPKYGGRHISNHSSKSLRHELYIYQNIRGGGAIHNNWVGRRDPSRLNERNTSADVQRCSCEILEQ